MSGYTDEVARETHDLIHNAEEEEQKAHPGHNLTQPDSGEDPAGLGSSSTSDQKHPQGRKSSTSKIGDKVKEVFHMKK
ncbi:unnamed protein product [Clonostachys byssicola]|uniref:Uncharacterized protein n=1 Tax=Clonostachys byssicola TaxID=160290 RepID=A0A9N9UFD4_9HYPO|nr:unnamed protein product [Clonostachys byssicola]